AAADEGILADTAKLMDCGVSAKNDEVIDNGVTAERRVVADDHAIPHDAVMSDMAARHEEASIANDCLATSGHGAKMEGYAFADDVVRADDKAGVLALVLQVLGRMAKGRIGIDDRARSDAGVSGDRHVTDEPYALR